MTKYKTLAELKAAIDEKRLVLGDDDAVTLDNDSTSLYVLSPTPEDPENHENVFNGGTPDELLRQALDLLGIPWEEA